jgi:hypothetical protein
MSGRNYTAGTRAALMALCKGTCYKPGCPEPVVLVEDGEPVLRLDIAHIRAENKGGPRYDEHFADPDIFSNLLLLCKPHHKLIDQIAPLKYSVEVLEAWKTDREAGGLEALEGIRGLTETQLQDMISDSFDAVAEKLDDALRRFAEVDSEAAEMLRGLRDEFLASIPSAIIDPDTASMVDRAASQLNSLWDTAPLISDAADRLAHLQDSATAVHNAADRLAAASETVNVLNVAVERLSLIGDVVAQLAWAAESLQNLPSETERLAEVIERWRRNRPEY